MMLPSRARQWMRGQAAALREQGLAQRSRRLIRKALRIAIGGPVRLVLRYPASRRVAIVVARATGLDEFAHRLRARFTSYRAEAAPSSMTPSARRIHGALQSAVSHPDKKRKF